MSPAPRISLSIPTFNRKDDVIACVRSLKAQEMEDFEAFIVDNGPSTDGTKQALADEIGGDGRFTFVEIGPEGCVVARNEGFRRASAPLLMTLDDDVELTDPKTLGFVVDRLDADGSLGVLGLSEYGPDGRHRGGSPPPQIRHSWWQRTTAYPAGRISRWGMIGTRFQHLAWGQMHEVDHVRSSSMAIRHDAFAAAGRFFEPYTAQGLGYRYETDLCVRVQKAGYKVVHAAREPQTLHKASPRSRGWGRQGMSPDYLLRTNRNNTYFFLANYWNLLTWPVFFAWDVLVGSTGQPGLYRFLRFHSDATIREVRIALTGKVEGLKMYFRHWRRR